MNFVYFRLHFIYPSGKPMAPHSLCCQEFAVDDYSFILGRLEAGTPSTFAHLRYCKKHISSIWMEAKAAVNRCLIFNRFIYVCWHQEGINRSKELLNAW